MLYLKYSGSMKFPCGALSIHIQQRALLSKQCPNCSVCRALFFFFCPFWGDETNLLRNVTFNVVSTTTKWNLPHSVAGNLKEKYSLMPLRWTSTLAKVNLELQMKFSAAVFFHSNLKEHLLLICAHLSSVILLLALLSSAYSLSSFCVFHLLPHSLMSLSYSPSHRHISASDAVAPAPLLPLQLHFTCYRSSHVTPLNYSVQPMVGVWLLLIMPVSLWGKKHSQIRHEISVAVATCHSTFKIVLWCGLVPIIGESFISTGSWFKNCRCGLWPFKT